MLKNPELWVAVSFLIFIGILLYYKIPANIVKQLDERAENIEKTLKQAQKLREEAQAMVAEYERKKVEAEKEIDKIKENAEIRAQEYLKQEEEKYQKIIEQKTKNAQETIERAKENAQKQITIIAADIALKEAEKIIREKVKKNHNIDESIIENSIKDMEKRFNI